MEISIFDDDMKIEDAGAETPPLLKSEKPTDEDIDLPVGPAFEIRNATDEDMKIALSDGDPYTDDGKEWEGDPFTLDAENK